MNKSKRYLPITIVAFALIGIMVIVFWQLSSTLVGVENYDLNRILATQSMLIAFFVLLMAITLVLGLTYQSRVHDQHQEEIFINQDWFSQTLLGMGEGVIATDQQGFVTSMNKIAEDMTGWKLSESKGKFVESIFEAINEETKQPIDNPINIVLRENRAVLFVNHTILIKKDKTHRYIVDSALPIRNQRGETIGAVLVFRDVTEQTLSRKKMVENEVLLEALLEHTRLVILIKDIKGKYLFINKQSELVYNIDANGLAGKNQLKDLDPNSSSFDNQVIKENRLVEYEHTLTHSDGSMHSYSTSKFPIYDDAQKIYAICTVSTDITERNRNTELKEQVAMQEIQLKSKIRYDTLTNNMPNMFFSLNKDLRYTSFNKSCENFTGVKASKVMGKSLNDIFELDKPFSIDDFTEVMTTGTPKNYISTFKFNEHFFTYTINIYATEDGISVLMTDLTQQTKAEMETLVLVADLQAKNKDLRQFAYALSHDLRAPIARIMGLVTLSNLDPTHIINNKSLLENVATEVNNLDNVVKDMNTVISVHSESKAGDYITFEKELDLIKKVFQNQIEENDITITADFNHPVGIVTVKSYLYSIMYNLMSNAIKYRLAKVPLIIHFETQQDEKYVYLLVKDNGMGIDLRKYGAKVFGLYNRFHGKSIEGKGIGLNLVKAQIESLGGKVEIESKVNKGSTFKISFPINAEEYATI